MLPARRHTTPVELGSRLQSSCYACQGVRRRAHKSFVFQEELVTVAHRLKRALQCVRSKAARHPLRTSRCTIERPRQSLSRQEVSQFACRRRVRRKLVVAEGGLVSLDIRLQEDSRCCKEPQVIASSLQDAAYRRVKSQLAHQPLHQEARCPARKSLVVDSSSLVQTVVAPSGGCRHVHRSSSHRLKRSLTSPRPLKRSSS